MSVLQKTKKTSLQTSVEILQNLKFRLCKDGREGNLSVPAQ